jgi:hypothetical protein
VLSLPDVVHLLVHVADDVERIEDQLPLRPGNMLLDRGDERPPHVEAHDLDRGSLLGGEALEEPVEGLLPPVLPDPFHGPFSRL